MINFYIINYIIPLSLSYLIGSIPVGYLISKMLHDDITKHGSGNIGSTNMTRTYGKNIGKLTFVGDVLKGIIVFLGFKYLYPTPNLSFLLCQILVVFGHCFSIFLKFKGGKGVATSFAIAFCNFTPICLVSILGWVILFYWTKIVSISSILALWINPIIALVITYIYHLNLNNFIILTLFNAFLIIFTHHQNITRLINGTENSFKK